MLHAFQKKSDPVTIFLNNSKGCVKQRCIVISYGFVGVKRQIIGLSVGRVDVAPLEWYLLPPCAGGSSDWTPKNLCRLNGLTSVLLDESVLCLPAEVVQLVTLESFDIFISSMPLEMTTVIIRLTKISPI